MALPAGCLSDDTQLRLAVSRSIGEHGFDPELFAKVELTVWPAYSLGAGRGSQVAAANLRRRDVSWATNFFQNDRAVYTHGGGNGAAMRIQPHVWAADRGSLDRLIIDVVADAVITHGHPRGIVGACLHALALRFTMLAGRVPGPDDWKAQVGELLALPDLVSAHDELGGIWLNLWEQRSETHFRTSVEQTIDEVLADIALLERIDDLAPTGAYDAAVEALEAFRPQQRGSGTKTALLASFLAWRSPRPEEAVIVAANRLGTDTDSIATMAGALLGAAHPGSQPEGSLSDRQYIEQEADRMWAVAGGAKPADFPYPDLRRWQPPSSHSDVLGRIDESFLLAGLGPVEPAGELHAMSGKNPVGWQWVDLWFGQRVLVKRRSEPPELEPSQVVKPLGTYSLLPPEIDRDASTPASRSVEAREESSEAPGWAAQDSFLRGIHHLSAEAINGGFQPETIGRHLLSLADEPGAGIERAIAYTAILAKARMSRREHGSHGRPADRGET